jgi:RHS repeat-associated protein
VYYYFGNVLGSAAITTATGSRCYDADFYPFGGELTFINTCVQNYKFAGMERDSASGLDRTIFRQYASQYGRWLSPDPYNGSYDVNNPQTMNRYSYVMNNPTSFVDPLGLDHVAFSGGCILFYSDTSGSVGYGDNGVLQVNVSEQLEDEWCGLDNGSASTQPYLWPTGDGGGGAPNNGPTVSHCLGVAAKAKGASIVLDALGSIPAFGNAVSATAGVARAAIAVDHVITSPPFALASGAYGAYGSVTAGPGEATDSLVGAASSGTGIGLTLADVSLEGTKAIPLVGNAVSVLTLGWDGYQAYEKHQSCMAGHE